MTDAYIEDGGIHDFVQQKGLEEGVPQLRVCNKKCTRLLWMGDYKRLGVALQQRIDECMRCTHLHLREHLQDLSWFSTCQHLAYRI